MAEKYEVVKTLIRGKQSERKIETQQGIKITAHKKPVGYALKDVNTGEITVFRYLEAIEEITRHGATNAQITVTKRDNGKLIPYIRAKAGMVNLQDISMVEDPVVYVKANKNVKVTPKMQNLIEKYSERESKETKFLSPKSKYTKNEILGIIEKMKAGQNQ